MPDNFDKQLEQVIHGRIAGRTLDELEPFLSAMEQEVDKRIMELLKQGAALAPEIAQQAWFEKYAVHQLRERLARLARAGHGAAKAISPRMTMEPSHA